MLLNKDSFNCQVVCSKKVNILQKESKTQLTMSIASLCRSINLISLFSCQILFLTYDAQLVSPERARQQASNSIFETFSPFETFSSLHAQNALSSSPQQHHLNSRNISSPLYDILDKPSNVSLSLSKGAQRD